MHKGFLKLAFLLSAASVLLGAFAAHGLKKIISEQSLATFETGVRYQFYHAIALIIAAILYKEFKSKSTIWACRFFVTGIILFSGSLYALALLPSNFSVIGAITPFGGICFILGWIMLFFTVKFSSKKSEIK